MGDFRFTFKQQKLLREQLGKLAPELWEEHAQELGITLEQFRNFVNGLSCPDWIAVKVARFLRDLPEEAK